MMREAAWLALVPQKLRRESSEIWSPDFRRCYCSVGHLGLVLEGGNKVEIGTNCHQKQLELLK